MKKFMLGFTALSLLLGASSCNKEETVEKVTDGSGKIAFSTALGKSTIDTRVAEFKYWPQTTSPNPQIVIHSYPENSDQEFHEFTAVYGEAFGKPGYTNVTSQWAPNDWYYDGGVDVDQPGFVLRYYSVYPLTGKGTYLTSETATATSYGFDYVVQTNGDGTDDPTTGDKQEDLIGASTTTLFSYVSLNYNHLLSQVNFAVQGIKGVEILIDDMEVKGVNDGGKFDFYTHEWSSLTSSVASPTYEYYPISGTTPAPIGTDLLAAGTTNDIVYLGNGGGSYGNTNALMLMPQKFDATAETADGQFSFKFSLAIDTDDDGSFEDVRATGVSTTVNLRDFQVNTWLPGKRYVYLIDFTAYLAGGPIRFNVAVNDWVDEDDDNYLAETIHVANVSKASIESAIDLHRSANATNNTLTVFPINVANNLTEALTITRIVGFKADDVINIEFPSNADAQLFYSAVPGWDITYPTGTDRVVTLTCVTPNDIDDYAIAVTVAAGVGGTVETAGLNTVIAAQEALNTTTSALKYFTITAQVAFTDSPTVDLDAITGFDIGDKIFIVCLDNAEALKIALNATNATDWSSAVVSNTINGDGNVVVLTKNQ